jgi:thioredoxin-related protein
MLTCKQVSKSLQSKDYKKLPFFSRMFLQFHVKLCVFCGKYNRQVMEHQDICRHYRENEEAILEHTHPDSVLNDEHKSIIKEELAKKYKANSDADS